MDYKKDATRIVEWLKYNLLIRNSNEYIINNNMHDDISIILLSYLLSKSNIKNSTVLHNDLLHKKTSVLERCYDFVFYDILKYSANNILVCNTISSDLYKWIRPHPNHLLVGDVFPFIGYTQFELLEFAKCIDLPEDIINHYTNNEKEISCYDMKNVHNITYFELNWANEINNRIVNIDGVGILESSLSPSKSKSWFMLTSRQKKIIGFLHEHIKKTNYKAKNSIERFER